MVVKDGVQRNIHFGVVLMRKFHQLGNIFDTVSCSHPCTESRDTYVDGIGTVKDGFFSDLLIFGRGEKFNDSWSFHLSIHPSGIRLNPLTLLSFSNQMELPDIQSN
ncbi:hypothetical protein SDC9_143425 [bioreactor metagenome]|uniref:Uncharacterized protein n=1 Tax=bioreactor metagenome TaxID=1076179 RepID=A0A645E3I4_9ZZZZ